jgi:Cys-tRNA(Pro)/Cys-tRNA(Cys) deacylase
VSEQRALEALRDLSHTVVRHGPVRSLAEAAAARGVSPAAVVKTLVVRRAAGDYLFVLVPGDRQISWPKLRALLGVSRMTLPSADEALEATGYERGTITPFGSTTPWPVVADSAMVGHEVTLGGGAHGVAVKLQADDAIAALDAQVADVTEPEPT